MKAKGRGIVLTNKVGKKEGPHRVVALIIRLSQTSFYRIICVCINVIERSLY